MPSLKSIIPRLCKDFVVASFDDTPMPCVVTALNYPGGDSINVYFDKRGQRGLSITDAGTTFETIRNSGFSITDESYRVIETTCRASGVEIVGIRKHLTASVKPTTIGVDCLAFCQCLSQVAGIIFHYADAN
jgi:hypothetical protein